MNTICPPVLAVAAANRKLPAHKKYFSVWIILALLLTLCAARAEGPDDEYLRIFDIIDKADTLSASNKVEAAHAKYVEAQKALGAFQRANPAWSAKAVSYRLKYLNEKIAVTSEKDAASDSTATASVKKDATSIAKSPVKLFDAGSEPRQVLRFHPSVGDKQTTSMTMKMGMTIAAAGQAMPAMNLPTMRLKMDMEVKDVSAGGDITYEMIISDATVDSDTNALPMVVAAMKTAMVGMRGMSGTGKMSDHGISKGIEMKMPAGADPQMSQTMDQLKESFANASSPLPDEPVGPSAKWEHKIKRKSQGMNIDEVNTYELVSIEGNILNLRSTITQSAARQKIENPAMPGLKVDLNKMTGAGTGTSTLNLSQLMPTTATADMNTEMVMGMDVGQQKQSMTMKLNVNVTLESK